MIFLFPVAASALVLLGAQAVRMMRAPLLEDEKVDDEPSAERTGPFTRLLDIVGRGAQRFLLEVYGRQRFRHLAWRLRAAGQPEGLTAQLFVQREAGFITIGLVLFLVMLLNDQLLIGLGVGLLFAGWMQLWLWSAVRKRLAQVERDLPDFLDVFAVTVAAGLPFRIAMQRVAERHTGPLAEEILSTLREMQLGVARREALEALRARTRSENVSSFVTALLQAEELGTPLEDALRQISKEVRRERAQQVKRAAAKAQPKVSSVVTFTIVPGAIILIVGGLLVANADVFSGLMKNG